MYGFKIGDRVVKNPATWQPGEFDGWGAGEGIGLIVEPPWDHDEGVMIGDDGRPYVDVRWPTGRCFRDLEELLPAAQSPADRSSPASPSDGEAQP